MDLIFRNARLIDPEAQTDDIGSLRVTDGRIAGRGAPEEAAPKAPPSSTVAAARWRPA